MSRRIIIAVDQLSRPQPGGIASYVHGLLRGLSDVDSSDAIVAMGPPDALAKVDVAGVAVPSWKSRAWGHVALGVPRDGDVVHAPSMMGPFGRARRVQSATLHDLLWRDEPDATTRRGARFHEQRLQYLLRHEEIRLLTSSPLLPQRLRSLGVAAERIYPVRLGVDSAGVAPASSPAVRAMLASAGVVGPFTLHAGTREPRKNTARLVEAHARARSSEPGLGPLVFVGPDGWGAADTGDAVVLGMVERDLLLGLYREATVVAYVPRAEGFGLPPVEALRAGTRVVASANCPSVVGTTEAVLVDPLDVDAIAAGLVQALAQPDDDQSRAKRMDSVSNYTWRNCALDHLAAWA